MKPLFISLVIEFVLLGAMASQAASTNSYVSEVDRLLTVYRLGVLPVKDNVNGLYARYVELKLTELVRKAHRFDFVDLKEADAKPILEDYETNHSMVRDIWKKYRVDALIAAKVTKNVDSVELTVDLLLANDGNVLAQETKEQSHKFEVSELEKTTSEVYGRLIDKIPYKGLVLSRQGNRVTINMGTDDGLKDEMILAAEQIISVKRHPKFNFLVSSEKEILGRIKIVKADESLSFGVVLEEKQKGVISVNTKLSGVDFINYHTAASRDDLSPTTQKYLPKDNVSFGKNPKEWTPPAIPSIGKVGLGLGVGTVSNSMSNAAGSFTSNVPFYPEVDLNAELWITQNWYFGADLREGVLSFSNPQNGSAPASLSATNSGFDFKGGYKFLFQDDFFGPQLNLHTGYGKYSFFIDASTPITFTSVSYGGMLLGIGGSFPISSEHTFYIDANLDFFIAPSMTETPYSSGSSGTSTATRFNFGAAYRLSNQFFVVGHLNFEFYNTNFSGTGTNPFPGNSTTQNLTTLVSGLDYLF